MVGGAGFCARVAIHSLFVIYHIPAPFTGSALVASAAWDRLVLCWIKGAALRTECS